VISRLAATALPAVGKVERSAVPQPVRAPVGCALGSNARGDTVLVDVPGQLVCRYDPRTGARGTSQALTLKQDPVTPGLVAVADDGRRALVMACAEPHGDPALVLVDLEQRTTTVVHHFAGRGWIVGGFSAKGLIACEQHLGGDPLFVLQHLTDGRSKTVFSIAGMMQPCVPAAVRFAHPSAGEIIAFVGCLQPDAVTFSGPMSLCVLDLTSAAVAALAPASGTVVRAEPDLLVVEGGAETVRVFVVR
jgi:hypothetical protein